MTSRNYKFELLQAMLDELEAYLLSSELFWPLAASAPQGEPRFPRMTLGNLLLAFDELKGQAEAFTPAEAERYHKLQSLWDSHLEARGAAIQRKAAIEQRQRLQLWRIYLDDLSEGGRGGANYTQQARSRAIFDRLAEIGGGQDRDEDLSEMMAALDARLRASFAGGEFVLHPSLQQSYEPARYWYLYGRPKS